MLGVVLLALSPLINAALQLDDLLMAAVLGVTAVPLTLLGGLLGILQGERRWGALLDGPICLGAPRLAIGLGSPAVASGAAVGSDRRLRRR